MRCGRLFDRRAAGRGCGWRGASLSAYLVYRLADPRVQKEAARFSGNAAIRFEYTVISNIYSGGLPPAEAGAVIVDKVSEILTHQAAGNRLGILKGGNNP